MASNLTTILSLANSVPLSSLTAYHWYSDHPSDTDFTFNGCGAFSGGDLPFGMVIEVHDVPTGTPVLGHEIATYAHAYAHIANNAALHGGYSSTLPVEEFYISRPRQLIRFYEPTTSSISLDIVDGVFLEIWGLYIDIPLITPTQMTFTETLPGGIDLNTYGSGDVHTAISGEGTLALGAGCIGVQINLDPLPPYLGSEAGAPPYLFDVGWINWGDGFATRDRERITSSAFQSFPRRPQYAPAITYSLSPGVTMAVTELLDRAPSVLGTLG